MNKLIPALVAATFATQAQAQLHAPPVCPVGSHWLADENEGGRYLIIQSGDRAVFNGKNCRQETRSGEVWLYCEGEPVMSIKTYEQGEFLNIGPNRKVKVSGEECFGR